jgi:hypothetical protein
LFWGQSGRCRYKKNKGVKMTNTEMLLKIKENLIKIQKTHHNGYDFNTDPCCVTLLEGEFDMIDDALKKD